MSYPARAEGLVNMIIEYIPFPRVLALCEMQTALCRIWTQVSEFTSYGDNRYSTSTSKKKRSYTIKNLGKNLVVKRTFLNELTLYLKVSMIKKNSHAYQVPACNFKKIIKQLIQPDSSRLIFKTKLINYEMI